MAGYLFGLDSQESLSEAINSGLFTTRLTLPDNIWKISQEGTFADYTSMKAGDDVYFFIKRKIYGIGSLINVGGDCKCLNYPGANRPEVLDNVPDNQFIYLYPADAYAELPAKTRNAINYSEAKQQFRFVCFFKPNPFFFNEGVDMDDMLTSDPTKFKILRDFYNKSCIKLDEDENQAFKNLILRRNFNADFEQDEDSFNSDYVASHELIATKLSEADYSLDIRPFLNTINDETILRHEMAIEACLIHQLTRNDANTVDVFGAIDYVSHQVPASPDKPNNYLDRIDVFGYTYIPEQKPTKSRFLLVEIKKDEVTKEHLFQLMKYVDFIKDEYSYRDYSMIDAFLVGYNFTDDCVTALNDAVTRKYIHGIRPSVAKTWKNVKLVKYSYDPGNQRIDFDVVEDAND